jgi:MFS family permease
MASMKLMVSPKMMKFNFLIVQTGIVVAFYSGYLVVLISQCFVEIPSFWNFMIGNTSDSEHTKEQILKLALFCLTVFGTAEVIGGVVAGRVIKKIGKRTSLFVLLGINISALLLSFFANWMSSYALWFFASFCIGLWDSFSQTLISTILGSEFKESAEPFAVLKCLQSFTILALMLVESFI